MHLLQALPNRAAAHLAALALCLYPAIAAAVPPAFTSAAPPNGAFATAYTHTFTASGTPAPTFNLSAAILPPGLTLSTGGVLSGTPSAPGEYTFTIRADNGDPPSAFKVVSIVITQATQTITFAALADRAFGSAAFQVSATGGDSGNPVVFTASGGACTASGTNGTTITIVSGGTCKVTANQEGTTTYAAATAVERSFTVTRLSQAITFAALADRPLSDGTFSVSGTGGASGNPVTFRSLDSFFCTTSGTNGTTVTLIRPGTCEIEASQAGNASYDAAPAVARGFNILKGSQAITFAAPADRSLQSGSFDLAATGGASGQPVVFASQTTAVCTTSGPAGATVTLVSAGTCTITATQSGSANYDAATPVTRSFVVTSGVPAVSLSAAALSFGGQSLRTTSRPMTITVSNTGSAALNVTAVSASAPFAASHNCQSVAAGANCAIQVSFTPLAEGANSGSLAISHNASPATSSVTLSGTGERSLVTHFYSAILGRSGDAGGIVFWDAEAKRVRDLGANVNEVWFAMAIAFYGSAEYVAQNPTDLEYIADLYGTFFNRAADSAGQAYWAEQLRQGMSRQAVLLSFLFSTEFADFSRAIFGEGTAKPETDLVMDFYRGILGRLPDSAGFNSWVARFAAARCSGSVAIAAESEAITSAFFGSAEYVARARPSGLYVADLYNAFLRRGGDIAGVNFWVQELDSGRRTRDNLRRAFLASPEFQARLARLAQGCS